MKHIRVWKLSSERIFELEWGNINMYGKIYFNKIRRAHVSICFDVSICKANCAEIIQGADFECGCFKHKH